MKILVTTGIYPPDIGGPATYSELLFKELPKRGIGVDVQTFGSVRHMPKIIRHIAFFVRVLWHGRASDMIFAQDTVSVGLPSLLASLLLGKQFIVRIPGDYAWEQSVQRFGVTDTIDDFQKKRYGTKTESLRRIQAFVVSQADQAIAPSKYFADLVRGWVGDETKVLHIYNGVDLDSLGAVAGGSFKPNTMISAGRLVPWKGFDMLIRAMAKLPGWHLSIAGDGPEMPHLQALISKRGLESRVTMLGRIDKPKLCKLISESEIFALNTSFESFSFQIVEAMAIGTPVIATRVGNIAEVIDDGRSGLLIRPDDEDGFIAAATRISSDRRLREGLAREGKEKAAGFSIDSTIGRLMAVLNGLASSPPKPRRRKVLVAKIARYLFSGGVSAFTDIALLYIFTDLLHIWYLTASILAFLVAFLVSFSLQKFFTFQDHSREGMHGQAAVYFLVSGANLLINTALIYLFVQYAGFHYIVAQIVTSIMIAVESFIIYGTFIFKKQLEDPSKT